MIEVIVLFVNDFFNIFYVVVGSGEDEERLVSLVCEYGIEVNVEFCMKIDDVELF